jgi:hypothetical protein
MYETLRTDTATIAPNPPASFLTNVGTSSIIKYGANDLVC